MAQSNRWQTTLWIMAVAQFISAIGFSLIFPFLPLYVAELGTNTGLSLEFWAGMVFSSQALTMAIAAPIWGSVADRLGHKLMVERALFGGAVILLLMGFARSAEELTLLRAIQGLITGTISAANAMIAALTPRERIGYAMGVLQVGLWTGTAAGPLIGGVLADTLGFRAAFIATAALLLVAGVLVLVAVPGSPPAAKGRARAAAGGWRAVLATPGVAVTYLARFVASLAQSMLLPFTPLYISMLLHSAERVGTFTGLVVGVALGSSTLTAVWLGRLGDRIGHRTVLMLSAVAAGLTFLPQGLISSPWLFLLMQALSGAAAGGMTPAASALLARYSRAGSEGVVYGLDNTVNSGARALAPLAGAAVVAAAGLPGIFVATAAAYGLVALVALVALPREGPAPGEARSARP